MADYTHIIQQVYNAFNKRDIGFVFSFMHEDVHWPNGWEGGYVNGYNEVREYWTRQWKEVNPVVTPVSITMLPNDKADVEVHQLVKDLQDSVVFDGTVHHVYTFVNEKIKSMEIIKDSES